MHMHATYLIKLAFLTSHYLSVTQTDQMDRALLALGS
jgi:hypothetical protein